jgi:hypothetical protein
VGLLTVDVTRLGVVMTCDSLPVEFAEGVVRPLSTNPTAWKRDAIIVRRTAGFAGLVGSVGTEEIGSVPTRRFLEAAEARTQGMMLGDFCGDLASRLTAAWNAHSVATCLVVFVAGVEVGEPRFWVIVNGDFDERTSTYLRIGADFRPVDNLAPLCQPNGGSTVRALLEHRVLFFRSGAALTPAAIVSDQFNAMLESILLGQSQGFTPATSIEKYAALVRMRQEFVKRLFELDKGVYDIDPPPIGGQIYVRSVALDGTISDHGKNVRDLRRL